MAHIRQIEPTDATAQLKQLYDAAELRAGSVANIIRLMSLDAKIATTR